jgi:hypothetical protein
MSGLMGVRSEEYHVRLVCDYGKVFALSPNCNGCQISVEGRSECWEVRGGLNTAAGPNTTALSLWVYAYP